MMLLVATAALRLIGRIVETLPVALNAAVTPLPLRLTALAELPSELSEEIETTP